MTARPRRLRRALEALLWLYPPDYRHHVGADVVDTHIDRVSDASAGPYRLVAAAWAVLEIVIGATLEWASLLAGRAPRSIRIATRSIVRRPGFSSVVILIIALGIGVNTAVFSLIDAVLLRPVPVTDPDRVVALFVSTPRTPNDGVPYPIYQTLAARPQPLSGLAASMTHEASLDFAGRTELTSAAVVSTNYFDVLGLRPQAGRLLGPADEGAPLSHPVAVLSDGTWTRLFDRRSGAVGSTLRIGATTFTVVGVAPRGFRGTDLAQTADVWVPLTMIQGLELGGMYSGRFSATLLTTFRGFGWLQLVGRLRPGVAPAQAAAAIEAVLAGSSPAGRGSAPSHVRAVPIADAASIADRAGVVTFSRLLAGVVALMLALACVNVGSLLTVRTAARERELGLTAALGASRGRLIGEMLLESLLLAIFGAVLGVALARLLMAALTVFTLPGGIEIGALGLSLDPRLVTFAIGLSCVTALACGVMPAVRAGRADPLLVRSQVRSGWSREPRGALVIAQVAIAVVIVFAAGLFIRSLREGLATDLGFDPDPLVAASVELRLNGYSGARAAAFYTDVVDRLAADPVVTGAAVTSDVPLESSPEFAIAAEGGATADGLGRPSDLKARSIYVTAGYFAAMGLPIIAGRDFDADDKRLPPDAAAVILNESAARLLWPDGRAVGRRVVDMLGRPAPVVGVVRDMKYGSLYDRGVACVYYLAPQQQVIGRMYVLARSRDPVRALTAVRTAITALDPHVPVAQSFRLRDHVNRWLAPQQFGSVLLSVLGFVALVISGAGIYATLAWRATLRRHEMGVRMALGAGASRAALTMLRRTGGTVAAGLVIGSATAPLLARGFDRFLFRVSPVDPYALFSMLGAITLAMALAVVVPIRRMLKTDPMTAMRSE